MSDIVIRAEGLGKLYRIGHREPYYTLRDAIAQSFDAPLRWFRNGRAPTRAAGVSSGVHDSPSTNQNSQSIWALKDVSFDVKRGEVIGIIGPNGAGKSTLLKILSCITEPTEGEARIHGRAGSLLEVGMGFHPELTGRENIYLNGAILGMKKNEIERKFDEIVAFAEVEKFLDTAVKHYSSGMYMRLAFSVAAHLEPEILLVDEVLAVGDIAFQKKCLGKMGHVAKQGRTVLFVSHNMRAVRQLCQRAIWLNDGKIAADGQSEEVVEKYLRGVSSETSGDMLSLIRQLPEDPVFCLEGISLTQDHLPVEQVLNHRPLEIAISYRVSQRTTGLRVFFDLYDSDGVLLLRSFHDEQSEGVPVVEPGHYVSTAIIPEDFLAPTDYEIQVLATIYNVRMCIPYPGIRVALHVEATGRANRAYTGEPIRGRLAPVIPWITVPA